MIYMVAITKIWQGWQKSYGKDTGLLVKANFDVSPRECDPFPKLKF